MSVETTATPITHQTEHPYIVQIEGVCGGRPIIKGTRISVRHITQRYKAGDTVEEILQTHPHLAAASVYDAISYYLDHQAEIEQEIIENRQEVLAQSLGFSTDEKGFVEFKKQD